MHKKTPAAHGDRSLESNPAEETGVLLAAYRLVAGGVAAPPVVLAAP